MKNWLILFLVGVCLLALPGCGCSKQQDKAAENQPAESSPQEETTSTVVENGDVQDAAERREDPPALTAGPGTYDANGQYIHPETIDQRPVIEYGYYDAENGGHKNILQEDDEESKKEPIAPSDDRYRDACERTYHSMAGFGASIDFHLYADGQHDTYQYAVTFDPSRNTYQATDKKSNETKMYTPEGTPATTQRTEKDYQTFCRACSFVPPLSLTKYHFDTTEEGSIVSTVTPGEDYREILLTASNLFNGFETYDASALFIGPLYYTAHIDAKGFLTGTSMQYTLQIPDSKIDITVIVNTSYE
ncbi:MAG: hypothetical protein HFE77_01090 [Clostridiales bacterium]|nr:hypothetical protein [Clostridiales bacterium]